MENIEKYIVLDLEMCDVPSGEKREVFNSPKELIQIGAVMLDSEYNVIDHFDMLVKPEYGTVTPNIQKLTGISQNDVQNATDTEKALAELEKWIPENSILVTWSGNDARQLDDELYFKDICLNKLYDFLDDYIDCQEIFSEKMDTDRVYQLSEALAIANIDYDENIHNAHADAYNTALLFKKLQTEDTLTLSPYYLTSINTYDPFKIKR
jgi:inhibitor of KinA sporulation pathway (predicted exonuclease)